MPRRINFIQCKFNDETLTSFTDGAATKKCKKIFALISFNVIEFHVRFCTLNDKFIAIYLFSVCDNKFSVARLPQAQSNSTQYDAMLCQFTFEIKFVRIS